MDEYFQKMKTIKIKQVGYRIHGIAILTDWYGQRGYIEMTSYDLKKLTEKEIREGLNDAGFGCQSIDGADLIINELYEENVEKFLENRTINISIPKKELDDTVLEAREIFVNP